MTLYNQHRCSNGSHAAPRRTVRYQSGARLGRALLSTLVVTWLSMAAMPGWAENVPDVRVLTEPFGSVAKSQCSSLGNLVTVTRAVQNFGGDLPAHQYYLYVSEITNTYTHGKDLDAHLHSKRYYLPAMPGQNRGKPVVFNMAVGTMATYVKKVPGPHALLVHLVENGVDVNTIGILVDPVETVKFPPGFCQPVSRMPPSQMHLQRKPVIRHDFGSGVVKRVAPPKPGTLRPLQPTAQIPPPKIRLISETHHVDSNCGDPNRLITFNVRLQNNGGPLATHKLEVWVEDDQQVLPYNGVAHEKWIPPLMSGATANVTLPVGVLKRNFGQLPGAHSLAISYYVGSVLPTGVRTIARKHVSIMLPKGICQPKMRVMSPAQMHLKPGGINTKNAKPGTATTTHRLRLPAVQ